MPSPFPGMDPYLEHPRIWSGLHTLLISSIATHLGSEVAPRYFVAVEERVTDQVRERYLEIRDAGSREVITVIEILSPTNKTPGEGRRQYLRKRQQVLDPLTSFVEFDLLRGGEPMDYGKIPPTHYRILVSHCWKRPHALLYPFNLNEAISEIPIPLRVDDQEPRLALGDLLAQVYDQVRYDLRIDYATAPDPPLDATTAEWARNLLQQRK